MRRARCLETDTSGSAGGPGKPAGSNPGRAPRSDPTVDLSDGQGLLGQVEGRNAQAVVDWFTARPQAWRDQVCYVAIDMCSVFKSAVRQTLPQATLVVDHFHIIQLANATVTEVRRRVPCKPAAGADVRATGNGNYATG